MFTYHGSDPLFFIGMFFLLVFVGFACVMYFMSPEKKHGQQYSAAFIKFKTATGSKSSTSAHRKT